MKSVCISDESGNDASQFAHVSSTETVVPQRFEGYLVFQGKKHMDVWTSICFLSIDPQVVGVMGFRAIPGRSGLCNFGLKSIDS
jgi:hypothetical protein